MLLPSKSYSKRNLSLTLPLKSLDITQNNFQIFLLNNQIKKNNVYRYPANKETTKISNNFTLLSQNKNPCIQYIYIYTLLPLTKPRIANIIQSHNTAYNTFYSSTRFSLFFFFFFFSLLPLPPLVFSLCMKTNH